MNLGLVGVGRWGQNYIRTLGKNPDSILKWVYSPNRRYEVPEGSNFTNNYYDVLKDSTVQGVIIATPPSTHYGLARTALLYGKDVLVEKPMTLSSKEASVLVNMADIDERVLMVGHIFKYNPALIKLKEIVDGGELGSGLDVQSYRIAGPMREDVNVIWDFCPHDIYSISYLFGKNPTRVKASMSPDKNSADLDLDYPGALKGLVNVDRASATRIRRIIVSGNRKRAIFDDVRKEITIKDLLNNETRCDLSDSKLSPLEIQCNHFIDCIRTRAKPKTDGCEGYINVKILEAAEESIRTREKVMIDYS